MTKRMICLMQATELYSTGPKPVALVETGSKAKRLVLFAPLVEPLLALLSATRGMFRPRAGVCSRGTS